MASNRRVVALVYDGLCAFEFGIASEIFGLARPELDVEWYDFEAVAATSGPIRMLGGIEVMASPDLTRLHDAGTVVVPGWPSPDAAVPDELVDALLMAHNRGARLVSICAGAFVLAATGLLDGSTATTHWRLADELTRRYPLVEVDPNVLFTDAGQILTSAGSAAGVDLGLHIVRLDHGAAVALDVARRLVMPPQRAGDQAQYIPSSTPVRDPGHSPISTAMDWILRRLGDDLTVEQLARQVHLSPRTFARRFLAEVGVTPHAWIISQRVMRARELLESTNLAASEVARISGFRTEETMRHHFRRRLDISPMRYRQTFGPGDDPPG